MVDWTVGDECKLISTTESGMRIDYLIHADLHNPIELITAETLSNMGNYQPCWIKSHWHTHNTNWKAARFSDTVLTPAASIRLCQALHAYSWPHFGPQRRYITKDELQVCDDDEHLFEQ